MLTNNHMTLLTNIHIYNIFFFEKLLFIQISRFLATSKEEGEEVAHLTLNCNIDPFGFRLKTMMSIAFMLSTCTTTNTTTTTGLRHFPSTIPKTNKGFIMHKKNRDKGDH